MIDHITTRRLVLKRFILFATLQHLEELESTWAETLTHVLFQAAWTIVTVSCL